MILQRAFSTCVSFHLLQKILLYLLRFHERKILFSVIDLPLKQYRVQKLMKLIFENECVYGRKRIRRLGKCERGEKTI